jgi:hypothetical protein
MPVSCGVVEQAARVDISTAIRVIRKTGFLDMVSLCFWVY